MKYSAVTVLATALSTAVLTAVRSLPAQSAHQHPIQVSISLNAEQVYQKALRIHNTWWEPRDPGIHLYRGILVQDDSCGCGTSARGSVFEKIYGNIVLKKELDVPGPVPKRASLVFIATEQKDNAADLEFVVNGKVVVVRPSRLRLPEAKQYQGAYLIPDGSAQFTHPSNVAKLIVDNIGPWPGWTWSRWHYVAIPADDLKPGKNRILVRSRDGKPGWAIMVADYANFYKGCAGPLKFPKTSAKSEDGGKTWREDGLGSEGKLSGEYVLRIFLDSYRPRGSILLPILDVAGEDGVSFKTLRAVREVRIRMKSLPTSSPGRTGLVLEVRTGNSPVYEASHWSAWGHPAAGGKVEDLRGRYLQWRVVLRSSDPGQSPELTGVSVEAEVKEAAQSFGKVKIVGERNFTLGEAPPGYAYENYESAYLKKFRRTFKLDQVVAGSRTEWERQQRLLYWAYRVPLKNNLSLYPWDPQNWIQARYRTDGSMAMNTYRHPRRDKMCLYSNVVLMAALQSFGYAARHVNLNTEGMIGHEICEVWSDRFGKWVFLDATQGFYLYDKKTSIPLNTLEMHNVLETYLKRTVTWRHPFLFTRGPFTTLRDLPMAAGGPHPPYSPQGVLFAFNTSSHLRIIPRNDVFSRPSPLPVSQGHEVWCWNGYLNWADAKVPPQEQFSRYTNRAKDFNWPLNQVRFVAEETSTAGLVSVCLSSNMPYLAALLANIDGKGWKKVESHFRWKLHAGRNSLEVKGRNTAGAVGTTASLVLEYQP
ncbi:MAG: hypothetical protein M1404_00245 [Acidobacteria bacterium]|nr:hypothetical protein [Acidobacteriota bacterium]